MKPKISIIVPVYNVEPYLRDCLESVLVQTFTRFELILVNDGSTDKSGEICDEYVKRDIRFKVIHKDNGGVSSARNRGIDIAQGEYIGFIDPDDTIACNMYERLMQSVLNHNVDIVVSSYTTINLITDTNSISAIWKKVGVPIDKSSIAADIIPSILRAEYLSLLPCWNKLYKRSLFDNHEYRFDENRKHGEDARLNLILLTKVNTIIFIKEPLYYYYIRQRKSLTQVFYEDLFNYLLDNKEFGEFLCNKYNTTEAINRIRNDFIIGTLSHMQDVVNSHLPLTRVHEILIGIMDDSEFKKCLYLDGYPSKYYRLLGRISVSKNVGLFIRVVKSKGNLQKLQHVLMGDKANQV